MPITRRISTAAGGNIMARLWLVVAALSVVALGSLAEDHEASSVEQGHHERDCGLCLAASRDDDELGGSFDENGTGPFSSDDTDDRKTSADGFFLVSGGSPFLPHSRAQCSAIAPGLGACSPARGDAHRSRAPPLRA
ncbi:MAG: hypothetical protein AAFW83_10805 [Pseudomonadota bacterium]